ncbi:putative leucine aminopeptidase [Paramyrothecium foliicola]|nr:putative leucine aminopeptidase [Paramyrothecium foliicola]
MFVQLATVALAAFTLRAVGAPAPELRLVKVSEEDPGQWVTEAQKWDLFTSKGIGFIDITDIRDEQVLENLATRPSSRRSARASQFPEELEHIEEVTAFIADIDIGGPQTWLSSLSEFFTRHYQSPTGREAATWIFDEITQVAAANPLVTVEQFQHSFDQPSVIARIPGQTEQLVIIGAHYDSTSGNASSRSPGADDNASGSVVVLESLRVLAEGGFSPQSTIEFHWYGGEEAGLLGSADIFAEYKAQGKNITSYLNQDMAGYSPSGTPAIIDDYTDQGLNAFLELVITEYTGRAPNHDACGYGCSDHASATANGYPAAFVFEDLTDQTSPDIHTPNDSPDTIQ